MWEVVGQLVLYLLMIVVYAVVFTLIYAKVMGGAFNRNKFEATRQLHSDVKFCDVLGMDEARLEAAEVVDFLKNAGRLSAIGAKVPRGILLVGPPGTGKTMLAKAIANEAGVPFYSLSGSDFVEVFVGVGAARIRALYKKARKHPAAIVFIDEIDALGRARTHAGAGNQEGNNTLNQFLVELDGLGRGGNVLTIGATNFEESLDPALLRPGRFDRKIHVGLPDMRGRREILAHYLAKVKVERDVDASALARAAVNMSGADLASMVNEASILAVREQRERVMMSDFTRAMERMGIGLEHSKTLSAAERRIVAYHEAGHALVGHHLLPTKRLHKVSIIPTGKSALGYTWSVQTEDKHLTSREEFLGEIAVLLGGRAAEELACAISTSGAHNDFQRASHLAEAMVWDLGMADGLPLSYRSRELSEATRRRLDDAVEEIVRGCKAECEAVLIEHRDQLERLAQALLTHEVLYEADVRRAIQGLPLEAPGPRRGSGPTEWVA